MPNEGREMRNRIDTHPRFTVGHIKNCEAEKVVVTPQSAADCDKHSVGERYHPLRPLT